MFSLTHVLAQVQPSAITGLPLGLISFGLLLLTVCLIALIWPVWSRTIVVSHEEVNYPEIPVDGVAVDRSGKVLGAGEDFLHRFAYEPGDVHGRYLYEIVSPESSSVVLEAIAKIGTNGDREEEVVGGEESAAMLPSSVVSRALDSGDLLYIAQFPAPLPRILVADDEDEYREQLAEHLRSRGFAVREGSHGAEAVEVAAEWRPDIVLMDLNMPGLNGFDASRDILRTFGGSDIRIVAVSGRGGEDLAFRCEESGMNGLLAKPFSLTDLSVVIRRHATELALAS